MTRQQQQQLNTTCKLLMPWIVLINEKKCVYFGGETERRKCHQNYVKTY